MQSPLLIADFFSGLHSWTKPYDEIDGDFRIFSIDNNPDYADHTTMIADFLTLTADDVIQALGGSPDVIYASPPCTTFSVASMGRHWGGGSKAYIPKTEAARIGIALLNHTMKLIHELNPTFYWVENPRGVMRKMPVMQAENRETVWFCRYGPTHGVLRAKPTDLWGRWPDEWLPRPPCKNGNPECDHERAPRGAKTGTQGLKGNAIRSLIPIELTREVAHAVIKHYNPWPTPEGGD